MPSNLRGFFYSVISFFLLCILTYLLNNQAPWGDEIIQMAILDLDFFELNKKIFFATKDPSYFAGDRTPPLMTWLYWGWGSLFGKEVKIYRVLSLLLFIKAFIHLRSSFNFSFKDQWTRDTLSILFIFNPLIWNYALEIRTYMLFICLSCWLCSLYIKKEFNLSYYLVLYLISLTHFYGLLIVIAFSFLSFRENKKTFKKSLFIIIVSIISLLPFILISHEVGYKHSGISFQKQLLFYIHDLFFLNNYFQNTLSYIIAGVLGTWIIYAYFKNKTKNNIDLVLIIYFSLLILSYIFIKSFNPLISRYSIWLYPFLFIILGESICRINKTLKSIFFGIVIIFIFLGTYPFIFEFQNNKRSIYPHISNIIDKYNIKSDDLILYTGKMSSSHHPLKYYEKKLSQFCLKQNYLSECHLKFPGDFSKYKRILLINENPRKDKSISEKMDAIDSKYQLIYQEKFISLKSKAEIKFYSIDSLKTL